MSQFANFDSPNPTPNPFAATPAYQQPPKKSNAWMWILLGVGGTVLVVCCGCVGFFTLGLNVIGNQIEAQLNADPTAQQHLGEVQSASIDWLAIGEETDLDRRLLLPHTDVEVFFRLDAGLSRERPTAGRRGGDADAVAIGRDRHDGDAQRGVAALHSHP